ncbi:hypothetical protein NLI96_g8451 [Meripilus lineatus]|uniref:Uncharacterized protein n=1 Tax=Meripilus lineatus TaxID=2056292 RepID=A0AAD5UX85_9APHY|nr:hypothetical protein NLI96_g8451 [Physisporinus lineatus]
MESQTTSDSTVEFFGLTAAVDTGNQIIRSPVSPSDLLLTPISDPVARLTRECSALRIRLATAERRERQGLLNPTLNTSLPTTPPSTLSTPPSLLDLHLAPSPGSHATTFVTYTRRPGLQLPRINNKDNPQPTRTPNPRWSNLRTHNKRQRQHRKIDEHSKAPFTTTTTIRSRNSTITPLPNERKNQTGMKRPDRLKQLEEQIKELQESLKARDKQIETLQKEGLELQVKWEQGNAIETVREAERERERGLERDREKERNRERALEAEREKERAKEREAEKEREIVRVREREHEKEQQTAREREREQEKQREKELQERELQLQRDREQLELDRNRPRTPIRSTPDLRLPMRPLSTQSPIEAYREQYNYTPSLRRVKSHIPLSREDSFASPCPPASPLPVTPPNLPQIHVPAVDPEQLAQLRSLEVFLTKTDGWSGAQVIQAVEDLNSEITHFAASAVESCSFQRRATHPNLHTLNFNPHSGGRGRRGKRRGRDSANNSGRSTPKGPPTPSQEALDCVEWLGEVFTKILSTKDHAQDPMLVQLALQATIATCCSRALSLFCVGFTAKLDSLLSGVFGHLRKSEPQPTTSRWRSLTHKAVHAIYPGLEEYAVSDLSNTMLRYSSSVFNLCGVSPAANGTGPQVPTKDIVPQLNSPTLNAQLRRIAEATAKIARVTREDILSTTFEVILVNPSSSFDEVGMINAFREIHFGSQVSSPNGNGSATPPRASRMKTE